MGIDTAEFERAGLYDPNEPNAAATLAMLEWLVSRGAGVEELMAAAKECRLTAVAADLALRPGRRVSLRGAAAAIGTTPEVLDSLRRAAAFSPRPFDQEFLTEADIRAFRGLARSAELFSEAESHYFARVLGSSLAKIAEAAVSLFLVDVEIPLRDAGAEDIDIANRNLEAINALDGVAGALEPFLRLHIEDAIHRSRVARPGNVDTTTVLMAIGFVDLVGFTSVSGALPTPELGLLVREFEDRAYDLVADHHGRVVKLIGDEVMFVTVEPADVVCAAVELIAGFTDHDHVTPRGGVAYGDLLARGGDYYGPTVNLASRIADLAVPMELLVTQEAADLTPALEFESAGRRQLKGFAEPVRLLSMEVG